MTETKKQLSAIPPARGEENALQGYTEQYSVAAELILKTFQGSDFERAILKDFRVEKVDDIQVVTIKRIDAYQVKWHVPPTSLTKSDLIGSDSTPGLLGQLADGWKALKALYPDKEVFVHLYTTSTASTSPLSEISDSELPPRHLAEFLNSYWRPEKISQDTVKKWEPFADKLQNASGLSDEEFEQFRLSCKFDLERRRPSEREEYDQFNRYYKDIGHLQAVLLKKAGEQQGIVTLTRQDILNLTNWHERFEYKSRHEFPTPIYYVPIDDTVQKLEQALQNFNQGYLALLGTPGSGKSTLLTRTLHYRRNVRVLRYYCFVPDDTALSRGEAYNFLHDLVLTLWNEGIKPRGHSMGDTIEQLRSSFEAQLGEIGNLWKEKGIRTIILVDGLDHIKREGNPGRSLLNELPQPTAIPEGCVFILGSQRIEQIELKPRIIQQLQENDSRRIITMGRLARRAIREIISKKLSSLELAEADLQVIESRSTGHPLALNYILNRLQLGKPEEISTILAQLPEYADNIELEYEKYWQGLENDNELRKLLALLSRMRGTLDLDLVSALANEDTVIRLIATAKHYFVEISKHQWKFFHNSFRQFILDKTGRSAFGIDDGTAHQGFHAQLAKLAKDTALTVFQWEQLYHTFHSGNYDQVLAIGTQAFFRSQFLASRPTRLIDEDIILVMRAAKERGDILAAFRVMLIQSELNQRSYILEESNIYNLLFQVGKFDEAIKHVIYEGHLLIERERALEFASDLADAGYGEAAREIFEAAEPLDKFSGVAIGGVIRHGKDVLESWVRTAVRFRSIEEIKAAISNLESRESSFPHESPEEETKALRENLSIELADAIIEIGKQEEIEKLPFLLSDNVAEDILTQRIAYAVISSDTELAWKNAKLDYLLQLNAKQQLPAYMLLRIAGILLRDRKDPVSAKNIFDIIPIPKRVIDEDRTLQNFNPYIHRLRYYRLSAALGKPIDPIQAVSEATQDHQKGSVLIERMVVRMANIWGKAWRGEILAPSLVIKELIPALRLTEIRDDQELRLAFSGKVKPYLDVLIHTAAAHGEAVLIELSELLEKRWNDVDTSKYWYPSLRRHLSLTIFSAGGSKEELVKRLKTTEPILGAQDDVREFMESCDEQAKAWAEIDNLDQAQSYILPMISSSFGLSHEKDSQIYHWMEWFERLLGNSPEQAKQSFRVVAQGIATASAYSRSSRTHEAAIALLSATAIHDPELADKLKQCFWNEHVLHYPAAMEALLIAGFRQESVNVEITVEMLRWLYLPYLRHFEEKVVEAFIDRLVKLEGDHASELLSELINAIKLEVAPQLCGKWWAAFDEELRTHSNTENLLKLVAEHLSKQKPKSEYTKGSVTLHDGTVVEEDEIRELAKSADKLIALLENIKEDRFYSWWRLTPSILAELNIEKTERLFNALVKIGKSGRDITSLIKKLNDLGSPQAAEEYALQALQKSESYGWSQFYDGGSRIEPYKTLITISDKYHVQAFKQFAEDYIEGYRPQPLANVLDDFAAVFWANPPIEALWQEIFEHFSNLREFSETAISLPEEFQLNLKGSSNLAFILIKHVLESYEMPQPELREDAYKAILGLYQKAPETRPQIQEAIKIYLEGENESPLLGMALIRGLVEGAPDLINKGLEKHLQHDDMAIRLAARAILSLSGKLLSVKRDRPLPALYSMKLPKFETMEDNLAGALVAPNATLPETADTLQLVGAAQEALEVIHRETEIPFRNLVERTAQLMKTIVPVEQWNSTAEKALMARCKALYVETSYRRPRAKVAAVALGYVVAELYDAGEINDNHLYMLEPSFSLFDFTTSQSRPVPQNLSPAIVSIPDDYLGSLSEWVEQAPEIIAAPPIRSDGWIVLGFITQAEIPRWEHPTEYTTGGICPPYTTEAEFKDRPEFIIPGTMMSIWWKADQYPGIPYLRTALERSLLIRASTHRTEIGEASWLAINPILPTELGWSFTGKGLFQWVDGEGNIMVESQWWRNGRLGRHAPADGIRAEGWVVRASVKGFEAIKNFILPAKWAYGVKKTYDKGETSHIWISVTDLTKQ